MNMPDNTKTLAAIDEAIEEWQILLKLDKQTGINNIEIAKGREMIMTSISALQAAKALIEDAWKPIESAPKGDQVKEIEFLAAVLDNNGLLEYADRGYFEYEPAWIEQIEVEDGIYIDNEVEGEEYNFVSLNGLIEEPTHWRSLENETRASNILAKIGGNDE